MIRRISILTTLVLGLSAQLPAQSGLEFYGFGMQAPTADVVSKGMADITTVPGGRAAYLASAPASWNNIRLTQLHVSGGLTRTQIHPYGQFEQIGAQNFQFLLHVNRRTAYGVGLRPVTRVNMFVEVPETVAFLGPDTLLFVQSQSSVGGMTALDLGYSRRIRPSVSIGAAINILFGTLTQRDTLEFIYRGQRDDLPPAMTAGQTLEFNGQTITLSLLANRFPRTRGQLGLELLLPLRLNLAAVKWHSGITTRESQRYTKVGLPYRVKIGYGLNVTPRQRLLAEVAILQLPRANEHDLVFDRHLEGTRAIRVAWSRVPGGRGTPNPGRIYYRVGFYRIAYYLSGSNRNPLVELGFTTGIGLRSLRTGTRLDLSLQYGRRGDGLPEVQSENFFSLSIGVTTGERWFSRPTKKWD